MHAHVRDVSVVFCIHPDVGGYLPGFDEGPVGAVTDTPAAASTDAPATVVVPGNGGDTVTTVAFEGVNAGGVGCCRFDEAGDTGKGAYTLFADINTVEGCTDLCANTASCAAFEVSAWEGCELHQNVPTHATKTDGCSCMTKKVTVAAATAPGTDAPSTAAAAATEAPTEAPATDAPTTAADAPATDAPTEAPATDAPTTAAEAPATDAPTTADVLQETVVSYIGVNEDGTGCCRFAEDSHGEGYTLVAEILTEEGCADQCTAVAGCAAFEVSAWEGCELHTAVPTHATGTAGCTCKIKTADIKVVTAAPSTGAPATDAPAADAPATDAPTTDAPTTISGADADAEAPFDGTECEMVPGTDFFGYAFCVTTRPSDFQLQCNLHVHVE